MTDVLVKREKFLDTHTQGEFIYDEDDGRDQVMLLQAKIRA